MGVYCWIVYLLAAPKSTKYKSKTVCIQLSKDVTWEMKVLTGKRRFSKLIFCYHVPPGISKMDWNKYKLPPLVASCSKKISLTMESFLQHNLHFYKLVTLFWTILGTIWIIFGSLAWTKQKKFLKKLMRSTFSKFQQKVETLMNSFWEKYKCIYFGWKMPHYYFYCGV